MLPRGPGCAESCDSSMTSLGQERGPRVATGNSPAPLSAALCQGRLWILMMAAVAALTVRLIPARGSAGGALHFPSQGVSPVIGAPPSVALAPAASPGSPLDRVMICASRIPGPGGTIVTAASAACAPCVLLMIVT